MRTSAWPGLAASGVDIENSITSITPMATGAPRLPHAMPRKARKVAGTRNSPSPTGWPRNNCTARNSGTPMSGATTRCTSLPRRGPTRSGASAAITPTVALAAASAPNSRCTMADTTNMPNAHEAPLST